MNSFIADFNPADYIKDDIKKTVLAFLASNAMKSCAKEIALEYAVQREHLSFKFDANKIIRRWKLAAMAANKFPEDAWDDLLRNAFFSTVALDATAYESVVRLAHDVSSSSYHGVAVGLISKMQGALSESTLDPDEVSSFLSELDIALRSGFFNDMDGVKIKQLIRQDIKWRDLVASEGDSIEVSLGIEDEVIRANIPVIDLMNTDPRDMVMIGFMNNGVKNVVIIQGDNLYKYVTILDAPPQVATTKKSDMTISLSNHIPEHENTMMP